MSGAIRIEGEWTAEQLRRLVAGSRYVGQSRHLLSPVAVLDGMSLAEAARIGGVDRQTLRDWLHRFNASGPEGLKYDWAKDRPRQPAEQHHKSLYLFGAIRPARGVGAGLVMPKWSVWGEHAGHARAPRRDCPLHLAASLP